MPSMATSIAESISASSSTIRAFLPPSSMVAYVRFSAAERSTACPVAVAPVKVIRSTVGLAVKAGPAEKVR